MPPSAPSQFFLYIGTYTRREPHVEGKGKGIYCFQYTPSTQAFELVDVAMGVTNPSYLTLSGSISFVYAVSECDDFQGASSGGVLVYSRDPLSGKLTLLQQCSTRGIAPCYVSVAKQDSRLLVSNYVGGNVVAFSIQPDGTLGKTVANHHFFGDSVNRDRQEASHPHSILEDPLGQKVYIADLGTDQISLYQWTDAPIELQSSLPQAIYPHLGAGPRHFTFTANASHLFVLNELDSTICVVPLESPVPSPTQTVSSLPKEYSGENWAADIHLHLNGKWLYASNRGHDSIALFEFDSKRLFLVDHFHCGGCTPRNFVIDPTGQRLIVANQDSDNLVVFEIDSAHGTLTPLHEIPVPTPVCVKMVAC